MAPKSRRTGPTEEEYGRYAFNRKLRSLGKPEPRKSLTSPLSAPMPENPPAMVKTVHDLVVWYRQLPVAQTRPNGWLLLVGAVLDAASVHMCDKNYLLDPREGFDTLREHVEGEGESGAEHEA